MKIRNKREIIKLSLSLFLRLLVYPQVVVAKFFFRRIPANMCNEYDRKTPF